MKTGLLSGQCVHGHARGRGIAVGRSFERLRPVFKAARMACNTGAVRERAWVLRIRLE